MAWSTSTQEEERQGLEASVSDEGAIKAVRTLVEHSPVFQAHIDQKHGGKKPELRIGEVSEDALNARTSAPGPVVYAVGGQKHDVNYAGQNHFVFGCNCGKEFTAQQGEKGLNISYTDGPSMLKNENKDPLGQKSYTDSKNTSLSGSTIMTAYDPKSGSGKITNIYK